MRYLEGRLIGLSCKVTNEIFLSYECRIELICFVAGSEKDICLNVITGDKSIYYIMKSVILTSYWDTNCDGGSLQ